MIRFIVGLTIGIIGTLALWLIGPSDAPIVETRKCMTQTTHLLRVVPARIGKLVIFMGQMLKLFMEELS